MNRRDFLRTTPALSVLRMHPPPGQKPRPTQRPERIKTDFRVALIGCGWYGKMDLMRLLQVAEVKVVALSDADQQQLDGTVELLRERHPEQRPRTYRRHEDVLARARPDLVLIETPDHWHHRQAIDALRAGCHVYLQKPITRTIEEADELLGAARGCKGVTQVALQRRSTPHLIDLRERYLDGGVLGEVHHVEMSCYYHMRDDRVREEKPIPADFDYDLWTGPAERLPYKGRPHRRWRAFREYGNGIVGDMCVHYFDTVRWLLDLGEPSRISSQGGIYVDVQADANTTDTQTCVFEYPERKLNLTWTHRAWGTPPDDKWPWSFSLHAANGTLRASTLGYEWLPARDVAETHPAEYVGAVYEDDLYPEDLTEEGIELHVASATRAHLRDWIEAILAGREPVAPLREGHLSTVACLRANEACRTGVAYEKR